MYLHTNLTNMHLQFSQFYVIIFFICEGWSDFKMLYVTAFERLVLYTKLFVYKITTMEALHFVFLAYQLTFLRKHAACI